MVGLTDDGLVIKTQAEILSDTEDLQRAEISPTWDPDPDQPTGQVNGINARSQALLWELLEQIYHSLNRDSAEGTQLDAIGKLVGVPREGAEYSTVVLDCAFTGPAGITLESGVHFAESSTTPGQLWTPVDTFVTPGPNFNATVLFRAAEIGPVDAPNGSITLINTPVSGWDTVDQTSGDADQGRFFESDTDYRDRQQQSLGVSGSTNIDAIRAALLEVENITSVIVLENTNPFDDQTDIPLHAFEAVVTDRDNATPNNTIGRIIWDNKPAGIQTYGDNGSVVIDNSGTSQSVFFSRSDEVDVWISLDAETVDGADLADDIKEAIVANYVPPVGQDITPSQIVGAIYQTVQGIGNIPEVRIGLAAIPSFTPKLEIGPRAQAIFDVSRIAVSISPWTP